MKIYFNTYKNRSVQVKVSYLPSKCIPSKKMKKLMVHEFRVVREN